MSSEIDIKRELRSVTLVFGAIMVSNGMVAYLPTVEPWMLIVGGLGLTQIAMKYMR